MREVEELNRSLCVLAVFGGQMVEPRPPLMSVEFSKSILPYPGFMDEVAMPKLLAMLPCTGDQCDSC